MAANTSPTSPKTQITQSRRMRRDWIMTMGEGDLKVSLNQPWRSIMTNLR